MTGNANPPMTCLEVRDEAADWLEATSWPTPRRRPRLIATPWFKGGAPATPPGQTISHPA
jgi:hypothetical protein